VTGRETPAPDGGQLERLEKGGDEARVADVNIERARAGRRRRVERSGENFSVRGFAVLAAEFVNGKEAERIGLVSLCVPRAELMDKAMAVANKLANGSQQAIRFTKRSLNGWMNVARPIFESSLAMEMLCFLGEDAKEGVASVREKRAPEFPSAQN